MRGIVIAFAASVLGLGSASAQEVYVEEETYVVEEPAFEEADPLEDGIIVGPRVYGWEAVQPADCGTYMYWTGTYCADARDAPPIDVVD